MKKRVLLGWFVVLFLFVVSIALSSWAFIYFKEEISVVFVVLLLVIAFANLFEVRLSEYGGIALDSFFIVSCLLNLNFPLAGLCVFLAELFSEPFKRKQTVRTLFNISQFTIDTYLISYALSRVSFKPGNFDLTFPSLAIFAFTTLAFFTINAFLHSLVVSLFEGAKPADLLFYKTPGKINFAPLVGMGVIGILFAYLVTRNLAAALLSLFPLYLLYAVFKRTSMLEETLSGALKSMVTALEAKDPYTADHSRRVADYSKKIAEKMGLPLSEIIRIEQAALLHDLGKIGTPDEVLYKPGKLGHYEWKLIARHPVDGALILETITLLKDVKNFVLYHHERANGSGYPHKKTKEEIPLGAQIIAVADVYDAMRSPRPYRRPFTIEEALQEISHCKAYQFDPDMISKFKEVIAENPHLEERPTPVCPLPDAEFSKETQKNELDA